MREAHRSSASSQLCYASCSCSCSASSACIFQGSPWQPRHASSKLTNYPSVPRCLVPQTGQAERDREASSACLPPSGQSRSSDRAWGSHSSASTPSTPKNPKEGLVPRQNGEERQQTGADSPAASSTQSVELRASFSSRAWPDRRFDLQRRSSGQLQPCHCRPGCEGVRVE